jgi:hypothetical protein
VTVLLQPDVVGIEHTLDLRELASLLSFAL